MTDTEPAGAEAEVGLSLRRGTVAYQVRGAVGFLRDGIVTLAAMAIAFAAFDDITTGNETDFRQEYVALLLCLMWLLFVAVRLIRPRLGRRPLP